MSYKQTNTYTGPDSLKKIVRWSNIESKIDTKQGNKAMELIPVMTGVSSNV